MDTLNALMQLMPPGIALDTESEEVSDLLKKIAKELNAYADQEEALFFEIDPRFVLLLLVQYEYSLGLPDECSVGAQTIQERREAIYNKMLDTGGARRVRFIDILKRLGQKVAIIDRFTMHTCESMCNEPILTHPNWLFTWSVTIDSSYDYMLATCESPCAEPLATWGNTMIECVLNKEKPAYTNLIFKYT